MDRSTDKKLRSIDSSFKQQADKFPQMTMKLFLQSLALSSVADTAGNTKENFN